MGIKVSADLYELTWGDLFNLVDLARGAGVDESDEVTQVPVENHDENVIDRFELELPNGTSIRRSPTLSNEDRDRFAEALDQVIERDGDARASMIELKELRDWLV
ncbi:hypothetical protein C8E05_1564 [Rhodococcus wratislaviensis]|uniref:DNA-binding protein n=1 Tax=Rhodococcus wratislaviensis TaxID=44752 RepID=A0AB38FGM6_RHOWR|nr:hypothetical protein [Rhodococcus wratislaviensis]REE72176.1 hypothetical protein C8E05_1564 [Rhodococcus wratislaviensis]SPZ40808.1 Uncharacterised protein [Rhodococcus wratislaviensis]